MMKRFLRDKSASFAIQLSIVAPMLMGTIGLAVDFATFSAQQSKLQETADMAALSAVREAVVAGWSEDSVKAVVDQIIETNLNADGRSTATYTASIAFERTANRLTVELRQDGHGYFLLGLYKNNPQIAVSSQAAIASSANVCLLALDPEKSAALNVGKKSSLTGNRCGVFTNSVDAGAIEVWSGSRVEADLICSSGGYKGAPADYDPDPVTDCPALPDPLATRDPPAVGSCNNYDTKILADATLYPGVYCGGIIVQGNGTVNLKPGVYVIKDGPFEISGAATLTGDNVGFYFTGETARTKFGTASTISLTAPRTGPMAGILFFEDRSSTQGRDFDMSSKDARQLVGAIYLPKGRLKVTGTSRFAEASKWTAIIVREVEIDNGPVLVLNSDYSASDIPVPVGISAETGRAFLTR